MNHEVAGDLALFISSSSAHDELIAPFIDRYNRGAKLHVDSEILRGRNKMTNEIRIEALEWTIAAMNHPHCRTAARRDVRELEGDVPATDEDDAAGKFVQLQEAGTRKYFIFAWDPKRSMPGSGGNDYTTSIMDLTSHLEGSRTHELCAALHGQDSGIAKLRFG
jgi:hypothetical protein